MVLTADAFVQVYNNEKSGKSGRAFFFCVKKQTCVLKFLGFGVKCSPILTVLAGGAPGVDSEKAGPSQVYSTIPVPGTRNILHVLHKYAYLSQTSER